VLTFGNWGHEESLQSGAPAASEITTKNQHQDYKYEPQTCLPDSFQARLELHPPRRALLVQARLELHPAPPRVTLLPCFPVILLNFVLYLPLYTSLYIPNFTSSNMEPTASQVRNHYSQKNQEAHLERALARALQKTANLHCQSNV